jgi:glucose dehydrogenase
MTAINIVFFTDKQEGQEKWHANKKRASDRVKASLLEFVSHMVCDTPPGI